MKNGGLSQRVWSLITHFQVRTRARSKLNPSGVVVQTHGTAPRLRNIDRQTCCSNYAPYVCQNYSGTARFRVYCDEGNLSKTILK